MIRKLPYGAKVGEFAIDEIKLNGQADMIVDDIVIVFRMIRDLPETPAAEDILYLNGCMWIFGVHYGLANLDLVRQTYAEALRLAQQPRVDRSIRMEILHRLADIDLQRLDWRQALRVYEQIRTVRPDDEIARINLVVLNYRLGQETQALTELDNLIAYFSDHGQS